MDMEITDEEIVSILKNSIDPSYWNLNDFDLILERAVEETLFDGTVVMKFACSNVDFFLLSDGSIYDVHPRP